MDTVLIGGMDRGIDYSELINFLSGHKVPHIILMEATGKRILEEILNGYPDFQDKDRLVLTDHLEDAVAKAKELTRPGHSCLMSPAAPAMVFLKTLKSGVKFLHAWCLDRQVNVKT